LGIDELEVRRAVEQQRFMGTRAHDRPPSMTTTWSACRTVEIRCATTITVESAEISRSDARTAASVCTSREENASSNR
jgi:hypothetical protein